MDTPNDRSDPYLHSFDIVANEKDELDQRYLVHNRTPHEMRLRLPGASSEFRIAPLGERVVRGARLKPYEQAIIPLREAHLLRVRAYQQTKPALLSPQLLALTGLVAAVVTMVLVFYTALSLNQAVTVLSLFTAGALVVSAIVFAQVREHRRRHAAQAVDQEEGDIIFKAGGEFSTGNDFNRAALDVAILLTVWTIGALAPAVAVYYGTDLGEFLNFNGRITLTVGKEGRVISRLIQICYLAILSLFPALLFFQFDRQRVGTIRGRWVQAIFRLDPRAKSLADVHAGYGDELAEASHHSADSIQVLGGRRSPLIVATVLLTLGWTILVLRTDSFDFKASSDAEQLAETATERAEQAQEQAAVVLDTSDPVEQAAALAGADAASAAAQEAKRQLDELADEQSADEPPTSPPTTSTPVTAPTTGDQASDDALDDAVQAQVAAELAEQNREAVSSIGFFQLLNPRPSAAGMAFLGAYFYAVYLVLHGYYRSDLRPKIYNQITARLAVVVVVAFLISVTVGDGLPDPLLWTFAFIAGVLPRTVLLVITDRLGQVSSNLVGASHHALADRLPLNEIEGIHLWERDRLITEGIGDLEALAHSNVVETMVRGRLKEERLVDWVDQALLLLHLDRVNGEARAIGKLRGVAIRRATQLVAAARAEGDDRTHVETALGGQPVDLLVSALKKEPNYVVVEQWRDESLKQAAGGHHTFYDLDGTLQCQPDPTPCEAEVTGVVA